MGKRSRLSRVRGWSVRCAIPVVTLVFCTLALAADPSKNVVVPTTQHVAAKSVKRVCYTVAGTSRVPQPCDRLGAIPTTANHMSIYGRSPETTR